MRSNPKTSRARSRGARANRGLVLISALVVLIAAAAAALARLASPPQPAAPQTVADVGPYELRLSGSAELGDALAPALVEAWLVSRGAETVDVSERKSGATPLPERVVSTRLGEQKLRIDVRALGERSGLNDLAAGHADIAMIAQPLQEAKPPSGLQIGVTKPAAGPAAARRLVLLPATRESAAARAFLAFAGSDAGEAIVADAGFGAPAIGAR